MSTYQALLLAIIEGLTEFLPISSTGHMVIASSLMGIAQDPFVKTFTVAIQFGAILSVVGLYWKRFFQSINFYVKLVVAVIPALILGALLDDYIDALLGNPIAVCIALIVGGVVLLFVDKYFAANEARGTTEPSLLQGLVIGVCQCAALLPGVSRAAASIVGGMSQGLTRRGAAEFSFFLAVPTMMAAGGYKLYKFYKTTGGFTNDQITMLAIGNLVAFIVAAMAIRGLIGYLSKRGFAVFGWYRIALGLLILGLYLGGVQLHME